MSTQDEHPVSDLVRRRTIAEEKLQTRKPPEDNIPEFFPAEVFAELSFLRSADCYFVFVLTDLMGGIYGGDAIAMHVKDGVAVRTFLFDDGEESIQTDVQPISISIVNDLIDTARDAGFFEAPEVLEHCSFHSALIWFGIRDHVGRSKWIAIPTGTSHAPIHRLLMRLLQTLSPECLKQVFNRFGEEDDVDEAEDSDVEPENPRTPHA
jgi:hypothetical protein